MIDSLGSKRPVHAVPNATEKIVGNFGVAVRIVAAFSRYVGSVPPQINRFLRGGTYVATEDGRSRMRCSHSEWSKSRTD